MNVVGAVLLLLLLPQCSATWRRRSPTFLDSKRLSGSAACLRGGSSDADDFYEVLGIKSDATSSEIKRAYKQRALETHPDRNKSPDAHIQFIRVGRAYETLKDPAKRALYDQTRRWRAQQRNRRDQHHSDTGQRKRERSGQHHSDTDQHEQWHPPPRSQPDEPYTMDDALKTFRSGFGYAVGILGESQLDRLLEADSPFYSVARSTWIATTLAYALRPNATAAQREETRRAIDAALTLCAPFLSRTIGRRNASRLLGFLALALTPLALSRYAVNAMPTVVRRLIVAVGICAALWRVARLDVDEREALVDGCSRAANASIDLLARIVGERERSQRWLVGVALLLVPLLLARAVGAVWSVLGLARLAAELLPGVVATWSLGVLVASTLWLAWKASDPESARPWNRANTVPNSPDEEEAEKAEEAETAEPEG